MCALAFCSSLLNFTSHSRREHYPSLPASCHLVEMPESFRSAGVAWCRAPIPTIFVWYCLMSAQPSWYSFPFRAAARSCSLQMNIPFLIQAPPWVVLSILIPIANFVRRAPASSQWRLHSWQALRPFGGNLFTPHSKVLPPSVRSPTSHQRFGPPAKERQRRTGWPPN